MTSRNQIFSLCHSQQYEEALSHAIQWTETEPENALAWSVRTFAHEGLGQYKDAFASINRAIDLASHDPANFLRRGQLAFAQNQLNESASDFERAAALAEKSGHAYKDSSVLSHAVVLTKLGRAQEAKERAALCPDDARCWVGEPIHAAQFKAALGMVH